MKERSNNVDVELLKSDLLIMMAVMSSVFASYGVTMDGSRASELRKIDEFTDSTLIKYLHLDEQDEKELLKLKSIARTFEEDNDFMNQYTTVMEKAFQKSLEIINKYDKESEIDNGSASA